MVPKSTLRNGVGGSLLLVSVSYLLPIMIATGATDLEQDEWTNGSFATAGTMIGGEWLGESDIRSRERIRCLARGGGVIPDRLAELLISPLMPPFPPPPPTTTTRNSGNWIVVAAGISLLALFLSGMTADTIGIQGLADRGQLPSIFRRRSRHDTPTVSEGGSGTADVRHIGVP
jgi:hypothetical protein